MAFWRKKNWEEEYDEDYADRQARRSPSGRPRIFSHLLLMGFIGAIFLGLVGGLAGTTMLEKTLTALASPVGLLWLGLIVMVYFCLLLRQVWPSMIGLFCLLLMSVAGNGLVANWLVATLESPYLEVNPLKLEPFDTIVLLGGATKTTVAGHAQITAHGSRVVVAAEMYHAGLVKKIICTGSQPNRSSKEDLHPREESYQLLSLLNVPKEAISQLQGENTSQEMASLKEWMAAHPDQKRIGLVTSTWHLPRALRLAESQGLEFIPIPGETLTSRFTQSPSLLIPSAGNLEITQLVIKEYLAGWIGR